MFPGANSMASRSHLSAAVPPVADFAQAAFDRALAELQLADPTARVALDTQTGLAIGVDVEVEMSMPGAARALPTSDRASAAAVLFLDRFGQLFGIPGWHVLDPLTVSPLGSTLWFAFRAHTTVGTRTVNVCADANTIRHVRVETSAPESAPT